MLHILRQQTSDKGQNSANAVHLTDCCAYFMSVHYGNKPQWCHTKHSTKRGTQKYSVYTCPAVVSEYPKSEGFLQYFNKAKVYETKFPGEFVVNFNQDLFWKLCSNMFAYEKRFTQTFWDHRTPAIQ